MSDATSSQPTSSFAVLSLFNVEPEHREEFTTLVHDFLQSQARWQAGLCSAELFVEESGQHLVTLVHWQDRDAFEAFKQSQQGRQVSDFGLALRPKVLFLHPEGSVTREPALEERLGVAHR